MMTSSRILDLCENGMGTVIYADVILFMSASGDVYVSFDGKEWKRTDDPYLISQFR